MTFLSVVTRTCQRPKLLAQNIKSVKGQEDKDKEHILIVDLDRVGIKHANMLFTKAIPYVAGEYVYILDDDCIVIEPYFISMLRGTVQNTNYPDVIMVRSLRPQFSPNNLPNANVWGNKNKIRVATTNSLCYVVKAELWKEKIEYYGSRVAGDWNFLNSLLKYRFEWLDLVVAQTQQLGRGRLFETGGRGWFDKARKEHGLISLGNDVWSVPQKKKKRKKQAFVATETVINSPVIDKKTSTHCEPIISGARRGPDKGHVLWDRRRGK